MRVVAGVARGRPLRAPAGRGTRPTSDRVREAVFSALDSLGVVAGATAADLFAGSGALGIEALSRGATHVTFVERAPAALAAVRANLAATGLAARASVVRGDVMTWAAAAPSLDLALVDPPYGFEGWSALLGVLGATVAVLESDRAVDPGEGWDVLREKHYGGTVVTIVRSTRPRA